MQNYRKKELGIAHVEIIVIVVVVLAVAGFIGWRVISGQGGDKSSNEAAADKATQIAIKEECKKLNDDDLCKFFTSWKASTKYKMVSTQNGQTSTFEVDGKKSRVSMTGEYAMDVITIDNATYTKAGDVWYKQTIDTPDKDVSKDYQQDFEDPTEDTTTPEEAKTVYKKHGKEACGSLTCFKYEVVDPASTDTKEYLWFDDKDYQLRKVRHEAPDGTSEMTFEYSNVSINVPSPVKELGPNQYIVPGQSEPMTIPSMQ